MRSGLLGWLADWFVITLHVNSCLKPCPSHPVMECPIAKDMARLHSTSPLHRISCEQWKMASLGLFARNTSQDMEKPSGNMAGRETQTPHIVLQSVA